MDGNEETAFMNELLTNKSMWSEVENAQDVCGRTYHVHHWYRVNESKWVVDDLRAHGEVLICVNDQVFWGQTWEGDAIRQDNAFWGRYPIAEQ